MSSQKNFIFDGHSLGTVTIKLNKKGISLNAANPLIYMVPEVWHITNRTHLRDLDERWFMTLTFEWP